MVFYFNGKAVECNTNRFNYSQYFGEVTDSLVQYDENTNTVTVDERASDVYARYATIHECVCCGRHQDMFLWANDKNRRCIEVDKMLISLMPESDRESYIKKRIEMFKTLLERNLRPDMNESFKNSLKGLEELLG